MRIHVIFLYPFIGVVFALPIALGAYAFIVEVEAYSILHMVGIEKEHDVESELFDLGFG
jgi:hypothetical protein